MTTTIPPEQNATNAMLLERNRVLTNGINQFWLINTGFSILFMQVGFMLLEAGTTRAKNVKSTIFKSHATNSIVYFLFGWGLFSGNSPFASGDDSQFYSTDYSEYPRMMNQFGFALTASTIVSGAVLSRMRLAPYILYSTIYVGLVYPISAHWEWDPSGWLAKMGFKDYAGDASVHVLGGACALVAAWMCGPRVGRFGKWNAHDDVGGASNHRLANNNNNNNNTPTHRNASVNNAINSSLPTPTSRRRGGNFASGGGGGGGGSRRDSLTTPNPSPPGSSTALVEDLTLSLSAVAVSSEEYETKWWITRLNKKLFRGSRWGLRLLLFLTGNFEALAPYRVRTVAGHSAALKAMGCGILFVSWFSFSSSGNGAFASSVTQEEAARAAISTLLGTGAGAATIILWTLYVGMDWDVDFLINGTIAALVSTTGNCAYIEPWAAVFVGVAGVIAMRLFSRMILHVFAIDDPLDASPVHLAAGFVGLVWEGLADVHTGLFYTGSGYQLGVQLVGGLATFAWGAFTTWLFFFPAVRLAKSLILYSPDEQTVGLDYVHFGGASYAFGDFDNESVQEFNEAQRIRKRMRQASKRFGMRISGAFDKDTSYHGAGLGVSGGALLSGSGANLNLSSYAVGAMKRTPSMV